ncbi:MAG TPA: hypothetical protein VNR64_20360 [Vicinamibacterales bacterium]|nr:hypothetical protein [Vicinamibacterales bacterium]
MKKHAERIQHLRQLGADLDRQIADAQELQKAERVWTKTPPETGSASIERPAGRKTAKVVLRARKRR